MNRQWAPAPKNRPRTHLRLPRLLQRHRCTAVTPILVRHLLPRRASDQQALPPAQLQAMSADMMARRGVVLPAAAATPAASGPSFTA